MGTQVSLRKKDGIYAVFLTECYNMFRQEKYIKLCEEILREVARRHGIAIRELSVMPDHVHAIVDIPPTMSISRAQRCIRLRAFQTPAEVQAAIPEGTFLERRQILQKRG